MCTSLCETCSQSSNLLNTARLRILKAREDHVTVNKTNYRMFQKKNDPLNRAFSDRRI